MNDQTAPIGHNRPPSATEILKERFYELLDEEDATIAKIRDVNATLPITTDEDQAAAGETVKLVRNFLKKVEQTRAAEKQPHIDAGRAIDGFFKNGVTARVEDVLKILSKGMDAYAAKKAAEERRKAEEARRQAEAEAARQREIAEREAARNRPTSTQKHLDRAEIAEDHAAEAERRAEASNADLTRVRSEGATVSGKTEWKFEITDLKAVDLEALRPYLDKATLEKAIRQFVRVNKGSAQLTGVRIFEDVKASVR